MSKKKKKKWRGRAQEPKHFINNKKINVVLFTCVSVSFVLSRLEGIWMKRTPFTFSKIIPSAVL